MEQQIDSERRLATRDRDLPVADAGAGGEMPLLVEFAIVRQVRLGHHAENCATVDDDRRIEQSARTPDRRADDQHGQQITRDFGQAIDRLFDRREQRILKKQIVNGIGGETQLREDHECGVQLISSPRQTNSLFKVCRNISNPGAGHARGDANEVLTVERLETRHETCSTVRLLWGALGPLQRQNEEG
jgi:hypothetical protein